MSDKVTKLKEELIRLFSESDALIDEIHALKKTVNEKETRLFRNKLEIITIQKQLDKTEQGR
jgi:hypothetical protein